VVPNRHRVRRGMSRAGRAFDRLVARRYPARMQPRTR
jgi:hypothetical protein